MHVRGRHLGALPYAVLVVCLASCGRATDAPVTFRVTAGRPDARLEPAACGGRAVIEVSSGSGIGSADVEVISRRLPEDIVLRLHLAGLEGFELSYGDVIVFASVSSYGDNAVHESVRPAGLAPGQEQEISPDSPYWIRIDVVPEGGATKTIPLDEGSIEVELPRDLIEGGHRRFSIRWVDFYR